jgi:hypothetical protein
MSRQKFYDILGAWIVLIVLPASVVVLSGTNCDQTTIKTVELPASKLATVNKINDHHDCDYPPYILVEVVAEGSAQAGYERDYDPGTGLFACSWWWAMVYRGLLRFDVASLGAPADRITGATLEFDLSTTVDDSSYGACPDDLLGSIWIVNEQWSPKLDLAADFLIDNTPLPNCIDNHHSVELSQVVRDWISGARPNFGLLFVGIDESYLANDQIKYVTTLTNVNLKVLVAVPVGP